MIHICNLQRLQDDAALNNTPLWFGEWAISTGFNATDEFLYKWADAQKLVYSQGKGWLVSLLRPLLPCRHRHADGDICDVNSSGTSKLSTLSWRQTSRANGARHIHPRNTSDLIATHPLPSPGHTWKA